VLVSALEQLTADAPTWLAKVYISRYFIGVCVSGRVATYVADHDEGIYK
jgi:hypothetical protein